MGLWSDLQHRDFKFSWISANRPYTKGMELLSQVIKAIIIVIFKAFHAVAL